MLDQAPARRVTPALELRDVSVRRCGRSLVQRVSLTVDRGEMLVLLGDAGSGTSTVLALLAGDCPPDAGRRVLQHGRSPLHLADALDVADGDGTDGVLLLDQPTAGLDEAAADEALARARAMADAGNAVVVTLESAALAARHATTIALFVAGRLVSWGAPAVALVPALQLLGYGPGSP